MTFVSYSQNFEDVILWRVLKDVLSGFYIDVGANDPIVDSVSYAFYQRGWRGIHIEPIPVYAEKIRAARPDETVIEAAVNDVSGELVLFDIANTGMSTGRENIATQHSESGFASHRITVPTIKLAEIFEIANGREIHWLKIDIEGMEEQALRSWGDSAARPWVVVVESTLPNSTETNFNDWEPHLVSRGYQFVYFDGLNRFYLHGRRYELRSRFDAPPNILDNFVLTENSGFARELARKLTERDAQLEALLNSRSMRLTAPIRWLQTACRRLGYHENKTHSDVP
jgi:FkbM family methyltransferase